MSDEELPRVLQRLWGRDEPRRGPKPGRSIGDIGAAAVRVADRLGLAATSMSAVADEIGVTTMALYRYVDSKQDLFVAMVDAAYGPPPARKPTGGWRRKLETWAFANRTVLARHPWVVQIPVAEPPLAPNTLRWMERGLSAFAATPLLEQQKLSSLLLVEVYVRGQFLLSSQLSDAVGQGELSNRELDERYARRLAALVTEAEFPSIHAALLSGSLEDAGDFADEEFRFGLDTVLDGIAALIHRLEAR
jgi:AcrR family transcriptional regulator